VSYQKWLKDLTDDDVDQWREQEEKEILIDSLNLD